MGVPEAWGHRAGTPPTQVSLRTVLAQTAISLPKSISFSLGRQQDYIFQISLELGVTM